ncbi:uncharacterized protein LOC124289682 [Haliotis rubra]|uniref:uncharacterized protein LOC124289682 n=1 Tax=Haliotis rubra TaxID=36100 RepID=UPI001EE5B0E2|nr:uncharacterized protein LOC124289682 [Haliotis rubra]
MWTVRLLGCYLYYVYATSVIISAETQRISVNETKSNWWDARKSCRMEPGRDLYISDTHFLPQNLHSNTSYWLGAMRYSTWIWTEDGTPLYKYDGYTSLRLAKNPKSLLYNSIYECQLRCASNSTLGLSGQECYCLEQSHTVNNKSAGGMPCPGNPDEMCGDAGGMSVYTRDTGGLGFTPTRTGVCAYLQRKRATTIKLDYYFNCIQGRKRRSAYYPHDSLPASCSGRVCVSAGVKSWIQAHKSNDLIKLNASTAKDVLNSSGFKYPFWIGLTLKSTTKWVDGESGYEDHHPWIRSPTSTCLALRNNGRWMTYMVPCHLQLAFICEVSTSTLSSTQSPLSRGDSTIEPSHPSTDSQSGVRADGPRGVIIGLAMGNVIFLLTVIAVVILLQRQRKLNLNIKERNQLMNSTENTTYDGLGIQTDSGAYSVVTPDTLDGQPFTAVLGATVNLNAHTGKDYVNNRETGEVQYHILEERSSGERGKSDVSLYEHTETAEGHYDTTRQEERLRKAEGSYSHIGAINKGFEDGDYDVANAGLVVNRFDDTYNHTSDTNVRPTDNYNT